MRGSRKASTGAPASRSNPKRTTRTKRFVWPIRLTDEEERAVNAAAELEGMPPRTFARVLVVGGARARLAGVGVTELAEMRAELASMRARLEEAGGAIFEAVDLAIAERDRARGAQPRRRSSRMPRIGGRS